MVNRPKFLLTLAMCVLFAIAVQADDVAEFTAASAAARAARERGDTASYVANIRKLAALTPGHPAVQIALARGMALEGNRLGAVAQLNKVAELGFSFDPSNDTAFQWMKDDSALIAAARRLADNGKGTGRTAGVIKLKLAGGSEGVAWSESRKAFLMGSGGVIYAYKLNRDGTAKPVAKARASQILGIRPDPASRSYLVSVNDPEGRNSAVVRHDDVTGDVKAVYKLPMSNAYSNDVALLPKGSFAVTDSNNGVFHLVNGKLEPLLLNMPVFYPNGIASDLETNRLYVAHAGGILVHDLTTGKSWALAVAGTLIGGIDGMVWHEGSLVAVQNLANARLGSRLLRITPDDGAQTARVDVLLAGSDFPGRVSTVAITHNEAFVIGTIGGENGKGEEPILIRCCDLR